MINKICASVCQHAVIEMTSMVVSFPSGEERRLQLMQDGIIVGDIDGSDSNSLAESVLRLLLHHKMIHISVADVNVSNWTREACEAVRIYLCPHDDERSKPIQRDQHKCFCDV